MGVKSYDSKDVAVIIGGSLLSGFAPGSRVTVARNEQAFTLQVGSDGESARSKTNNKSGLVTVSLLQTSESNVTLQAFAAADELANGGIVSILIKDNSGNSLFAAETAWVQKSPDAAYEQDAAPRDWIFETDNLEMIHGGN